MNLIKNIPIAIISLICIQLLSFNIIGKKTLQNHIIQNYKTYLIDREIAIGKYYSNLKFSTKQQNQLKQIFNVSSLNSVVKEDIYNNYWLSTDYNYSVEVSFKNSIYANVIEDETYIGFIANDKSEYIWILITWVKVKKENVGMT